MPFLKDLANALRFRTKPRFGPRPGPILLVVIRLPLGHKPTFDDEWAVEDLVDELEALLLKTSMGDVMGTEYRTGEAIIAAYVEDTDAAFEAVKPVLQAAPIARLGYALKGHGLIESPNVSPVRLTW